MSDYHRPDGTWSCTRDHRTGPCGTCGACRAIAAENRARPRRIQLRRTKGWRKPAGAVVVSRPSKWGNPFKVGDGYEIAGIPKVIDTVEMAVLIYRIWLTLADHPQPNALRVALPELAGRDLACWCPTSSPCHADVLLELANTETR